MNHMKLCVYMLSLVSLITNCLNRIICTLTIIYKILTKLYLVFINANIIRVNYSQGYSLLNIFYLSFLN
jgi:hypothetical protein